MDKKAVLYIDGKEFPINGERNLLEVIRKAGIDIPTFCYHSELSVYGACRLCIVDIEGMGIVGSCSTPPTPGLKVRTTTEEIREMRKITLELLLANHEQSCPTCVKNTDCQLQSLAKRLGVEQVRFKQLHKPKPVDKSSPSLVRDPNKCVLCGDCVRICSEIQGVGAIDFAYRGSQATVQPAFGKDLAEVECVNCGQCARVCPTGALTISLQNQQVWGALNNPEKTVVVQVAPAVRVALGEMFNIPAGEQLTGKMITALKRIGFDKVYDTSFTADLTVLEEAQEFIDRKTRNAALPQFTSCCPAWVKFAEQYYPEFLPQLSTCKSPQQMFGALARKMLPDMLGVKKENLVIVSIMPCTAKKFEAKRAEFAMENIPDVDYVLTTQELGNMIKESGLNLAALETESFDMPLGFKTGAGVIFGVTGGVSEAVLRYAVEKISGKVLENVDFKEVRGTEGIREASYTVSGINIKLALVHGLSNAHKVAESIKNGTAQYDLIEVMACPGGCIGGAGQPVSFNSDVKGIRTANLYDADKALQLHKSQENSYVTQLYSTILNDHHTIHELLHTEYQNRKRINDMEISVTDNNGAPKVMVNVCLGTGCFLRGAQDLIHNLIKATEKNGLISKIDVRGSFCFEFCDRGPVVKIGGEIIEAATVEKVLSKINQLVSVSKEAVTV
jgi:NADH-quinone oxidoreductase subunit G